MALSPRERQILDILRTKPLLDAAGIAQGIGTTKASVAVALSSLSRKGEIVGRGYVLREEPSVVVIGGAAMDIKARSRARVRPETSNPGSISGTPGGVGRNIAENLAHLGRRTYLVAAVGDDAFGRDLVSRTAATGVYVEHVVRSPHATGTYVAILDHRGGLLTAVSDMAATDNLHVSQIARSRDLIARADLVIVDGNIPFDVARWVLAVAAGAGVRVVAEPVSVAKARRFSRLIEAGQPIFAITPNVDELAALVGVPVANTRTAISGAAAQLHLRGVAHVWVSRGARGSVLSTADGAIVSVGAIHAKVVDVTGAGDAMTAGFVHGLLRGEPPETAARYGHVAAALTVANPHTVRPDLGVVLAESITQARGASR